MKGHLKTGGEKNQQTCFFNFIGKKSLKNPTSYMHYSSLPHVSFIVFVSLLLSNNPTIYRDRREKSQDEEIIKQFRNRLNKSDYFFIACSYTIICCFSVIFNTWQKKMWIKISGFKLKVFKLLGFSVYLYKMRLTIHGFYGYYVH